MRLNDDKNTVAAFDCLAPGVIILKLTDFIGFMI